MATISWCKQQKKGMQLIEPNENLSREYMQTAQETLDILKTISGKSKVWLATTKYYCEYFAIYSLMMRIGVKCEIHDCTIAISQKLEEMRIIPEGYTKRIDQDKQLRIDNQYYLKNKEVQINYTELLEFILTIKSINQKITQKEIKTIREEMTKTK